MTRQRARVGMIVDPSEVSRLACRDAISFPAFTLLFSMIGFGSLVHQSDLPLLMAVALTAGIWGLPGQLTLVEMHVAGASLFFVVLGVALANARFLPMVVSFMPLMPSRSSNVASRFVLAQMLSINSWAAGLRRFPDITPELRRRYYVLFGVICMGSGVLEVRSLDSRALATCEGSRFDGLGARSLELCQEALDPRSLAL